MVHKPMESTEEEIRQLNERRKHEKQFVLSRDLECGNFNDKYWFMISTEWLYHWKCFISNRVNFKHISDPLMDQELFKSQLRISENERIGILPPGPVNNEVLFQKVTDNEGNASLVLREGLEINKQYRSVNKDVWTFFHRMYGGGPLILREQLDIYSRDPSDELSAKRSQRKNGSATNNIFANVKSSLNISPTNAHQVA